MSHRWFPHSQSHRSCTQGTILCKSISKGFHKSMIILSPSGLIYLWKCWRFNEICSFLCARNTLSPNKSVYWWFSKWSLTTTRKGWSSIPIAAGLCHVVMDVSLFGLFCLNHLGTIRELFVIAVLETETGNLQYHLNCMQSTKWRSIL